MRLISYCRKTTLFVFMLIILSVTAVGQTKRIRPEADHFIIKCKNVIDPASETIIRDAYIEINNGKILMIGEFDDLQLSTAEKIVDYDNKYVIPGLIDTHGHLYGGLTLRYTTCDMLATFFLAAGVTSVRTPGSMEPEGDMGLTDRINSGRYLGPRYFHSGAYIEGDPVTVGWMQPVKTPEEVRLKVDQWIRKGAESVKVYASLDNELMAAAIAHGHAHGVKVIGHIGAVTYKDAIEMGIDELFHGILAFPDILPNTIDRRNWQQVFEFLSQVNLSQTVTKDILERAAAMGTVITPTVCVVSPNDLTKLHLEEQKKYYTDKASTAIERRLSSSLFANADKILEKCKEFVRMAHEAGCILTTGTDQVGFTMLPGFSIWREMEIFAEAGLQPMDILKTATINGAFAFGTSDLTGSIKPGKLADLVILNANPLENISNIRSVYRVVKGGVIYEPEKLLKPLIGKVQ